jgi:hypothetical protein
VGAHTVDGLEPIFAINHLGYFLLVWLLLALLRQTACQEAWSRSGTIRTPAECDLGGVNGSTLGTAITSVRTPVEASRQACAGPARLLSPKVKKI